ncbi:hypothetical protein [Promicromonospora panici]|uniref:hypothetical protein n=1 Tax=Promicromonospora panici TaxID=2219658 RepID=UPI00101D5069|nr:hypothetical protein [Promicromonospora panici]
MRRALFAACAAAAVAVAVVGCTAAGSEVSGDAAQADAVNVDAVAPGRELTDAEQVQVDQALELLVRDCMAAEGFRYVPVPVASVEERQGSGYVLDDVGWAREYGYGLELEDRVVEIQQSDPNHAYANALPEAERLRWSTALDGDPSDGMLSAELPMGGTVQTPDDSCFARAKDELYGDFAAWFQAEKVATNLVGLYAEDIVTDRRFVAELADWSDCMSRRGYDYPDPPAIRDDLYRLLQGLGDVRARAVEKELAVAEATCATRETALVSTALDLENEYRGRLDRYDDAVADYRRMQILALGNAERVLAG